MNLIKETKPKTIKSNIPTPIWRTWNVEEDSTPTNTLTKKKPKQNVKPVPRSWSNNIVERKHGKGIKIPCKHSDIAPKISLIDRAASTTSLFFVDNVHISRRVAPNKTLKRRVGSAHPTTGLRSKLTRKCTLHELHDIPALYTNTHVKPAPRSWSNNVVERKHGKGIKIPCKHSEDLREAQPSKSWVQNKTHLKPSGALKYGLFPQPRKVQSPNRNSLQSPTRLRGPNTRLWSPSRHYTGLNYQRANVARDKTRTNIERGDRAVRTNVKNEAVRAATKKGSSHYSVVSRAPPPPKLGLSDTMHLDIKPGKGRFVVPPR